MTRTLVLSCFFSYSLLAAGETKPPSAQALSECNAILGSDSATFDIYNQDGKIINYRRVSRDRDNPCGFPMHFVIWPGQSSREKFEPRIAVVDIPKDEAFKNTVKSLKGEKLMIRLGQTFLRIGCSESERFRFERGSITKSVRDSRGASYSYEINSPPENDQKKIHMLHDQMRADVSSNFDKYIKSFAGMNQSWVNKAADNLANSCDAYLTVDQKLELNKFKSSATPPSDAAPADK